MLIPEARVHKLDNLICAAYRARRTGFAGIATIVLLLAAIAPAGAFTAEQVDRGRDVFRLQCARCHGPGGQGIRDIYRSMTAPPLIGAGALPLDPRPYQKMRHFQFRTVRDVFEFASAVMPADQPASLSDADYWNAIAFILNANGMPVNGRLLNEDEAAQLSLASLQQRTGQAGEGNPAPAPVGNEPALEGQTGGRR